MKIEKYNLKAETGFTRFEFKSEGPNGIIPKLIEFQATADPGLFNLAFGDKNVLTGSVDDLAVSNNGDTEKILATVISALYAFCDSHKEAYIYASGSTEVRTRLYRMGITKYFEQMQADFYLYGQVGHDFPPFRPGMNCEGFLAQRKFD